MNNQLREELLKLKRKDLKTRSRLQKSDELYDGYNPEMKRVHEENAQKLEQIIRKYGWPTKSLVGEDGSEAAWLIFQHNISNPAMFRRLLPLLEEAANKGDVNKFLWAKTIDRISMYEGEPQIYGTNFDWDKESKLSPWPIKDPNTVDKLRTEIGLPPLEDSIKQMRHEAKTKGEKAPTNYSKYREKMEAWCRSIGWR